jgi:hypothetical protein
MGLQLCAMIDMSFGFFVFPLAKFYVDIPSILFEPRNAID